MDQEELERKKRKKRKRTAEVTAVAAVTSAGLVVGGAFQSPDDILNGNDDEPLPMVETMHQGVPVVQGGDGAEEDETEEELEDDEKRRSPGARIRSMIWRMPVGVRALIAVPLWVLGWLMLSGLGMLWGGALSPLVRTLAGWAAGAALLLGAFALTAKSVFPDLPLKKIVNRRSFWGLVLGSAALAVVNAVVPLFWDGYGRIGEIVRAVGSAGVLGAAVALFARRENARRRKAVAEEAAKEEKAPLSPEAAQALALQKVRDLVDEVSGRRTLG